MIDPRLRQRVETVAVRPTVVQHQSNAEVLAAFQRHLTGKVAEKTVSQYARVVEDAMAFMRDGAQEVPVRRWTRNKSARSWCMWSRTIARASTSCRSRQAW